VTAEERSDKDGVGWCNWLGIIGITRPPTSFYVLEVLALA
jgi:hypothetical protein